jgi:hypothetical protein
MKQILLLFFLSIVICSNAQQIDYQVNGSFSGNITATNRIYTILPHDFTITYDSTLSITDTLPDASQNYGRILIFHRMYKAGLLKFYCPISNIDVGTNNVPPSHTFISSNFTTIFQSGKSLSTGAIVWMKLVDN